MSHDRFVSFPFQSGEFCTCMPKDNKIISESVGEPIINLKNLCRTELGTYLFVDPVRSKIFSVGRIPN